MPHIATVRACTWVCTEGGSSEGALHTLLMHVRLDMELFNVSMQQRLLEQALCTSCCARPLPVNITTHSFSAEAVQQEQRAKESSTGFSRTPSTTLLPRVRAAW